MCGIMCDMSEQVMRVARELLRRRVLTQQKDGQNDLMNAVGQATFLDQYERLPTIDDLQFKKNYLEFVTQDDSEQSVRVISTKGGWDYRVWSNMLDTDVFVFARYNHNDEAAVIEGWMPRLDVENSGFEWWENEEGKKISYYHSVDSQAFLPMPEVMDFIQTCPSHEVAWWDVQFNGWRCFGCDRILYDSESTVFEDIMKAKHAGESRIGSSYPSSEGT